MLSLTHALICHSTKMTGKWGGHFRVRQKSRARETYRSLQGWPKLRVLAIGVTWLELAIACDQWRDKDISSAIYPLTYSLSYLWDVLG